MEPSRLGFWSRHRDYQGLGEVENLPLGGCLDLSMVLKYTRSITFGD